MEIENKMAPRRVLVDDDEPEITEVAKPAVLAHPAIFLATMT